MESSRLTLLMGAFALIFGVWTKAPEVKEIVVYAQPQEPKPIVISESLDVDYSRDKHCLAVMVYGEARGESFYGKSGVAWVALNRYDSSHYSSICDVVLDDSQFNALKNPKLKAAVKTETAPANAEKGAWDESLRVAGLAFDNIIPDPTKGATHFVNYQKLKKVPRWVRVFKRTITIENHQFYKNV